LLLLLMLGVSSVERAVSAGLRYSTGKHKFY
jgi:hypothetical protein